MPFLSWLSPFGSKPTSIQPDLFGFLRDTSNLFLIARPAQRSNHVMFYELADRRVQFLGPGTQLPAVSLIQAKADDYFARFWFHLFAVATALHFE